MMQESQVEHYLCDQVKRLGGKALKLSPTGTAGMPDRLVLFPGGWAAFVELKAPGERPRPLQQKRAAELRGLGFGVYCLGSYDAVDSFIGVWTRFLAISGVK